MAIMQQIYKFISSMKTGLVLLLMIGLASAAGASLLPGTFFKTAFFEALLVLLLLNMTLCTVNRLKTTCRLLLKHVGSRAWFRQAGILLLHGGMILILLGAGVYAFQGQESRIHLCAGEQVDMSRVLKVKHPFTVRLNEFRIDFNEDGSPSQYVSEITVLEQGKKIKDISVNVNNPLNYNGVKAYQSSFGHLVEVQYTAKNGAKQIDRFAEGDLLEPANTDRTVKIYRYIPNFNPAHGMNSVTMRPDNPHIIFSVYAGDKLLGIGTAKFNEPTRIDEDVYLVFKGVEPYTILQVKADPGLPLALTGGILLLLGICLAVLTAPAKKSALVHDL